MASKSFPKGLPNWFQMACCATPLLSLLVASLGVASGASVNPAIIGGLVFLSWRVIAVVTGTKAIPLIVRIPSRESSTPKLE